MCTWVQDEIREINNEQLLTFAYLWYYVTIKTWIKHWHVSICVRCVALTIVESVGQCVSYVAHSVIWSGRFSMKYLHSYEHLVTSIALTLLVSVCHKPSTVYSQTLQYKCQVTLTQWQTHAQKCSLVSVLHWQYFPPLNLLNSKAKCMMWFDL